MKIQCPECNSDAYKITPPWALNEKVFGCSTCGATLRQDGTKFMTSGDLADVFRANTLVKQIFPDMEELPPLLRSVLYARVIEFGTQMWLDGLKQGLLYGEIRNQTGNTVRGSEK